MMGHREWTRGGTEREALSHRWRRFHRYRPGVLKQVKRFFNKRVRKRYRNLLKGETWHALR